VTRLVITVSNFGSLAVVAVDNPGVWSREEFTGLLHPDDAERIYAALGSLGYTVVPEEPLWRALTGAGRSGSSTRRIHRPGGSGSSTTCDHSRGR
jgi:hypothetical protein